MAASSRSVAPRARRVAAGQIIGLLEEASRLVQLTHLQVRGGRALPPGHQHGSVEVPARISLPQLKKSLSAACERPVARWKWARAWR